MVCPKCGGENVFVQTIQEQHEEKVKRGFLYWLFIGWWLEILLWLFLTIPRLLIALFVPKRKRLVTTTKTMCVCQGCGYSWDAPDFNKPVVKPRDALK